MLVLSRKVMQKIQIGPQITITILRMNDQTVRVGIDAPRDMCILRAELIDRLPVAGQDRLELQVKPASLRRDGLNPGESAHPKNQRKADPNRRAARGAFTTLKNPPQRALPAVLSQGISG